MIRGLLNFLRGTDLRGSRFRYKGSRCDEFAGGVVLGIRFLDATEEGGHSLSTEKFIGEIP